MSTNTQSYASIRKYEYFSFLSQQEDIKISLMILKTTTTKDGKKQKFSRKVQENPEAIQV